MVSLIINTQLEKTDLEIKILYYYIIVLHKFLLTWKCLALVAMRPLMGTIRTMTARPAKTDGPSSSHRKTTDRMICRGQDHSRWMKLVTSLKRWASADIRFTVSPTVDSLRASLETHRAFKKGKESVIFRKVMKTIKCSKWK